MPNNKVWEKTGEAFKKDSEGRAYANEYLAAVRGNWQATESGVTRGSALIVGIAFIFELVISSKSTPITFLGFGFSTTGIVKAALPIVIAYLYYQVTYSIVESIIYRSAHDRVLTEIYPPIYNNSERPLHPANALMVSPDRIYYTLGTDSRVMKLAYISSAIRPLTIMAAAPFYIIYTYVQLFQKLGVASVESWISVSISGVLLVSGCINALVAAAIDL